MLGGRGGTLRRRFTYEDVAVYYVQRAITRNAD
jgi:hypothetical protein